LSPEDLGDLLERPIVATLATYRRSGEVLLSPVWHEWRDGGFEMFVGRNDVKTEHVRRDPRASVVVYEDDAPYRGIEVRGQATISDDVGDLRRRIWQRYLGVDPIGPDSAEVLLRVEGVIRAWDFSDDFGQFAEGG
jgi:PPOX class probable F420-dependent enzyme